MNLTRRQTKDLRAGRPVDRPEIEIVGAILRYLELVPDVVAWRQNSRVLRMPGKGGRERLVRFGVEGLPDIGGWRVLPGPVAQAFGIEVKRPGETTRPAQAAFLERLRQDGGIAIVATSIEDVAQVIR